MMMFDPEFCGARVRPSPNFGPRRDNKTVSMIVLHYTGMKTGLAAEDRLCDPEAEVSAHYLVYEDGAVVQMVEEAMRAWHAGKSFWHGERDVNSVSIGIEIVNEGHEGGCPSYPELQIREVIKLCQVLVQRHGIKSRNIVGHSDIAPGRKVDPGEHFPWKQLYEHGLGIWIPAVPICEGPELQIGDSGPQIVALRQKLERYGFSTNGCKNYDQNLADCVSAFQQRYRPSLVDGIADISTTSILDAWLSSMIASDCN